MRLLHTSSLELKTFNEDDVPSYAILSHVWGEDEFTFEDLKGGIHQQLNHPKKGLEKVLSTCKQAKLNGLSYVWIDTCCIDKSSSAELSEAINSMFEWYQGSAACFAFMEDVDLQADGTMARFDTSKWFTRGWTLQELIAPYEVTFFDRNWKQMKARHDLVEWLEKLTGIEPKILRRQHSKNSWLLERPRAKRLADDILRDVLSKQPIATKMAWAARRETTRQEDLAYCLMGLFNINMPLLYGEGNKAFMRLQEEILRNFPDQSILTWTKRDNFKPDMELRRYKPYLSEDPIYFMFSPYVGTRLEQNDIVRTAQGLEIDVLLGRCQFSYGYVPPESEPWLAVLSCGADVDNLTRVAIFVKPLDSQSTSKGYRRLYSNILVLFRPGGPLAQIFGPGIVVLGPSLQGYDPYTQVPDPRPRSFGYGLIDFSCDFSKFEPRRILLPAVQCSPPEAESVGKPTQLGLEIRGCGTDWQKNVVSPFMIKNSMILYGYDQQLAKFFGQCDRIRICGILFVCNDRLGFFVIWGTKQCRVWLGKVSEVMESHYVVPDDFELLCWAEPWDILLAAKLCQTARSDTSRRHQIIQEAALRYKERHKENLRSPANLQPVFSQPPFGLQVRIEPTEFLGRRRHTLAVEIEGWEEEPLLVVDYVEVVDE